MDPLLQCAALQAPPRGSVSEGTSFLREATIFSYDGEDFVRTATTLIAEGQSAANTKLDRDSSAYKALVKKRSYTGPATIFGRDYQANYAPLTGEDGQLTGALFVGVPK